ncbi:MAG: DEAD/DEAH box helicase, partial [Parvularcula sp.]|nr:DEAD/DEAH box helicase [Parvularcula sp.]
MKDSVSLPQSGYAEVLARINDRAADAVIAKGRVRSRSLREDLVSRLRGAAGRPDGFVADPVFEAARVWKRADQNLDDLVGTLLEEELVAALDRERLPSGNENARRWPRIGDGYQPYLHQIRAWQEAEAGRSFMVTSGTGSGKTECFMIPMLNDLLREAKQGRRAGVKAIVLYPLNALIDSQKERLSAWIDPLANWLSYANYNGLTPENPPPGWKRRGAEIPDRKSLRADPPSLLVTNVTMLEYMLMRAQDRGILAKSQGTLRWIVLDEAHSYVGAQAAEMAMLLRRVRQAFGVAPEDVRLAATSATIGEGEEARETLRRFLADLAGLSAAQVEVIEGQEIEPSLPSVGVDRPLDPDMLPRDYEALWDEISGHPRIRKIRQAMRSGGISLREAGRILGRDPEDRSTAAGTVKLLEAAAQARDPKTGVSLSPWRLHVFHRAQGGLWACIDPACPERGDALTQEDADWPFGQVHLSNREHCGCGAPVYEIGACDECGTPWLLADVVNEGAHRFLRPASDRDIDDEYVLDVEPEGDDAETPARSVSERVVIGAPVQGTRDFLRLKDGAILEIPGQDDHVMALAMKVPEERRCCDRSSHRGVSIRPQRFGAPFLMGNALPLLVEAAKPNPSDLPVPFGGRRLLSFTDSRQGTARFSAKLQQEAERTLTRAIVYHSVQERS